MRSFMRDRSHPWWGPIIANDPELADQVMGAIRERGPLGSRDFEGKAVGRDVEPEAGQADAGGAVERGRCS